jgi:hypothetical protein
MLRSLLLSVLALLAMLATAVPAGADPNAEPAAPEPGPRLQQSDPPQVTFTYEVTRCR